MKRFLKIVERIVGYALLLAMVVAVVIIVGQPQTTGGNQDAFSGSTDQKKRLAVFLDGTWNQVNSNTNVWRMRALCAPKDAAAGTQQLIYYEVAVNGSLGGVFGKGLDENIRLAYEWLVENYNDGDEIYIFGFSRGAYTARSLAGLIAKLGVLKPRSPIGLPQLYDRYKRGDEETIWRLADMQSSGDLQGITTEERSQRADVKMVGVWDTVGSLGLKAFSIEGISRSSFDFLETGLRIHILSGYHALAIDEHRGDFAPTLWSVRHPKDPKAVIAAPRDISNVEQRWFVGAHANVGGGYAMWYLGTQLDLPTASLPDEIRARGFSYWERRVGTAVAGAQPDPFRLELGAIGQWCLRAQIDDRWLLEQLTKMLRAGFAPTDAFSVVERLQKLSSAHPDQAVAVLSALLRNPRVDRWAYMTQRDPIRAILSAGITSGRAETNALAEELIGFLSTI